MIVTADKTLCSICAYLDDIVYDSKHILHQFYSQFINNFLNLKLITMAKTQREKTIHKAMRSADKFYNEIPGTT